MEIRLKRSEFLAELLPMQGIVERRTTIPVLSHILLKTDGDGIKLAATDLDVSLTSFCPAEADFEGGIAVQAKKFTEIVRNMPDGIAITALRPEKRSDSNARRMSALYWCGYCRMSRLGLSYTRLARALTHGNPPTDFSS